MNTVLRHAIKKQPLAFLAVMAVATVSVAGVWFLSPLPKKSAGVVFHIDPPPRLLHASAPGNQSGFTEYMQSQMALVKDRRTLNAAIEEPEIHELRMIQAAQPDPLTWLENNLTIDTRNSGGELMRITIDGERKDELLTLLKAVTKAYLSAANNHDNSVRLQRQEELEKAYTKAKAELGKIQNAIDEIAKGLGSRDGATLAILDSLRQESLRAAIHDQAYLRDELEHITSSLESAATMSNRTAVMAAIGATMGTILPHRLLIIQPVIPPAVIEHELRRDPNLLEQEREIARLAKALKDIEAVFAAATESPQWIHARAELTAAEEKRVAYYREARARVVAFLKEKVAQNGVEQLDAMQAERDRIQARIDKIKATIVELQKEIEKSNALRIELENMKADIAQKEKLASRVSDEIERIKLEGKVPPRVTVLEEPFIVPGTEGDTRLMYAILAGFGVCIVGFGGIIAWEFHRAENRRLVHMTVLYVVLFLIGISILIVLQFTRNEHFSALPIGVAILLGFIVGLSVATELTVATQNSRIRQLEEEMAALKEAEGGERT